MLEFLKTDTGLIIILFVNVLLFISVIISNLRISSINKNSKDFMRKLGDGKDIREDLNKYMDRIVELESGISETNTHCKQLDKQLKKCVQKIGVVRYNAYKDSGSDLSFAVAMLDEKNDGIVFNGIYSREMSNIYAKPIIDGISKYTMTKEEQEAVSKAVGNEDIKRIN